MTSGMEAEECIVCTRFVSFFFSPRMLRCHITVPGLRASLLAYSSCCESFGTLLAVISVKSLGLFRLLESFLKGVDCCVPTLRM